MASGQILAKLRKLYSKMNEEVENWKSCQNESLSLLRTASNVITRLPVLQDPHSYGALQALPGLQQKLLQKQMLGLEAQLVELQRTLDELEAVCQAMERLATNAARLVQQDKRLTPAARAASAGPVPSIDQCLQGLQDICSMHQEELRLKRAVVSEVRYDTPEEDLQQLVAVYAAAPNIDAQRVGDLLYIVAATEEVKLV